MGRTGRSQRQDSTWIGFGVGCLICRNNIVKARLHSCASVLKQAGTPALQRGSELGSGSTQRQNRSRFDLRLAFGTGIRLPLGFRCRYES